MICNMQSARRKPKWKKITLPVNSTWRSLCYNDVAGVFVAVDYNTPAQCIYSHDGIHWNKIADYVSVGLYAQKLFLWRGMFTQGCRRWSEDGKGWRKTELPNDVTGDEILGNGQIVKIDGNSGTHSCAVSTDGINWTKGTFPECRLMGKAYFNEKFLVFSLLQNEFWYSDDGLNWTSGALPVDGCLVKFACSSVRIVGISRDVYENGVRTNPGCFYSYNGISWIQSKIPCEFPHDIIYAFDKFHIISETGEVYSSDDCLNWSQAKGLFGDRSGGLHYEQGKLFYFYKNDMYYTSDGETWRKCEFPIDSGEFLACGKGRIVVLNYSGNNAAYLDDFHECL